MIDEVAADVTAAIMLTLYFSPTIAQYENLLISTRNSGDVLNDLLSTVSVRGIYHASVKIANVSSIALATMFSL